MKKLLVCLLVLLLVISSALAEFDTAPLRADPNLSVYTQHGTVNTIYCPMNQPYLGQVDEPFEGDLVAYVDYITLVDADATLLRLRVSTTVYDYPLHAEQVRLTVGGKRYTLAVSYDQDEYDLMYMEDYAACLTDAGLPLLKAIAQQKNDDPIPVELIAAGEVVFSGRVVIPGEEAAQMYDRFINLGGKKQDLKKLDAIWPCEIEKVK